MDGSGRASFLRLVATWTIAGWLIAGGALAASATIAIGGQTASGHQRRANGGG